MKKTTCNCNRPEYLLFLSLFVFLYFFPATANSQTDYWKQKSSLGNREPDNEATGGFVIGNSVFLHCPSYTTFPANEIWEFSNITNWNLKSTTGSIPNPARVGSTTLSNGKKGYILCGRSASQFLQEFWEYDSTSNKFTRLPDFPGAGRQLAIAFIINEKLYFGLGSDFNGAFSDFWMYDFQTANWAKKSDFPGSARDGAIAFSIGGKGYAGAGNNKIDFYQYDPLADSWTPTTDFPANRSYLQSFSLNGFGFALGGYGANPAVYEKDFYRFDATDQSWKKLKNLSLKTDRNSIAFSNGEKAFMASDSTCFLYDAASDSWKKISKYIDGFGFADAAGFTMGNSGFLLTGKNAFWQFFPEDNKWVRKQDFPGPARYGSVGFVVGGKGYIATGQGNGNLLRDLWQYDSLSDSWQKKNDFPGSARSGAVSFTINGNVYIGTGTDGNALADLWKYDELNDTWSQMASLPGLARSQAVSFAMGNYGYVVTGRTTDGYPMTEGWKYDAASNLWSSMASFPGTARHSSFAFTIKNLAYIGCGFAFNSNQSFSNDFYSYDAATDTWSSRPACLNPTNNSGGFYGSTGLNINNRGYQLGGRLDKPSNYCFEYSTLKQVTTLKGLNEISNTGLWYGLLKNEYTDYFDKTKDLVFQLNPLDNNFQYYNGKDGKLSFALDTGSNIRIYYGWFGNSTKEYAGVFMRNYCFAYDNISQPASPVKIRLYYYAKELDRFVEKFNNMYNANKTTGDIKIVAYSGQNRDLDFANNEDDISKYKQIDPGTPNVYGINDEYRYIEFETNPFFSEYYLVLTSPVAPSFTFTGSGLWTNYLNWNRSSDPPVTLPIGTEILIDPTDGACIVDTPVILPAGVSLRVAPGKTLTINGNLIVK